MSFRLKRVNSLLLKEINLVVQQKIGDPRVGFVTLTGVQVSPDLRNAKVFIAATGDEKRNKDTLDALNHARAYVQSQLANKIILKYIPEIKFYLDKTLQNAERIEKIIEDLANEEHYE